MVGRLRPNAKPPCCRNRIRLCASLLSNPSKIIGTPANDLAHVEEARRYPQILVFHRDKPHTINEQAPFLKASCGWSGHTLPTLCFHVTGIRCSRHGLERDANHSR